MSKSNIISSIIEQNTSATRRNEGAYYLSSGRISRATIDQHSASLAVEGSRRYDVRIEWSIDAQQMAEVHIRCTCPDFSENKNLCKHTVAGALYIEKNAQDLLDFTHSATDVTVSTAFGTFSKSREKSPLDVFLPMVSRTAAKPERMKSTATDESRRLNFMMNFVETHFPEKSRTDSDRPADDLLREIWYELSTDHLFHFSKIMVKLCQRVFKDTFGKTSKIKPFDLPTDSRDLRQLRLIHSSDLDILKHYTAVKPKYRTKSWAQSGISTEVRDIELSPDTAFDELAKLCETKRCYAGHRTGADFGPPAPQDRLIQVKTAEKFHWVADITPTGQSGTYEVSTRLKSDLGTVIELSQVYIITSEGIVMTKNFELLRTHPVAGDIYHILQDIQVVGPMKGSGEPLVRLIHLFERDFSPEQLNLPAELQTTKETKTPTPSISFLRTPDAVSTDSIYISVTMHYDSRVFDIDDARQSWTDQQVLNRTIYQRDFEQELELTRNIFMLCPDLLDDRGMIGQNNYHAKIPRHALVRTAIQAIDAGWKVNLEGAPLHKATKPWLDFESSGIDWFNVNCEVTIDGDVIRGMDLLAAAQSKPGFIRLSDGRLGLIDDAAFMQNLKLLERFANASKGGIPRISKLHATLLEMEAICQSSSSKNSEFKDFFRRVKAAYDIQPCDPPKTFKATLRPYQREGLGWLNYLRHCGFGGCLADDMGLGKTIQVLALLDEHHANPLTKKARGASLVIAPKSLVYNWLVEANRFAPQLKIAVLENRARQDISKLVKTHDVVIASYQITRSELTELGGIDFEYVILDEAHYIKNRASQISRAVKLLKARHRLALTGTPIENRLADLASIFEFLNPGLSGAGIFKKTGQGFNGSEADRILLTRVLKPFLLRRTKKDVLRDLPPKTESTIYCDLTPEEQKSYDSMAKAVRDELRETIESSGIRGSQIHILAALTRLRQAACHLALVDKNSDIDASTKIDVLIEYLKETIAEGEKALVFSQFTELLRLVKSSLDAHDISYSYLDGQTRNRQQLVDQFNDSKGGSVFLISLKAGGVGLNLTSASTCFLLDPWWNPAVEAQAIDRTHRIGQTKPVFAYRLIARGTVEEKILTLQASKRELAESILNAGEGSPRALTLQDLNLLLS